MSKLHRFLPLLAIALAACATPVTDRLYQAGATRIELSQAVSFPVHETQRAIQAGRLVTEEELDDAEPYCVLRLRVLNKKGFTLQPGQFRVLRVTYQEDQFASFAPLRIASGDDAAPSLYYFQTEFRLESIEQPELYSLTCQHRLDYPLGEHLSMADFHTAAGTLLRLGSG